jgi:hypothetical protein
VEISDQQGDGFGASRRYRDLFDRLFIQGQRALLAKALIQDVLPTEGGRWGTSVVFTPDEAGAELLGDLTREAARVAGPGQWSTGARGSAHLTVRSVERYRERIPAGDPLITRCTAALRRTADQHPLPVRLQLAGLTLTPSSVMACAYPIGPAADSFSSQMRTELGPDAWFEDQCTRDIWYVSLIHFAGPIPAPGVLVEWVRDRRDLPLGEVWADAAHVATFAHDGHRPVLTALATVGLPSGAVGAPSPRRR